MVNISVSAIEKPIKTSIFNFLKICKKFKAKFVNITLQTKFVNITLQAKLKWAGKSSIQLNQYTATVHKVKKEKLTVKISILIVSSAFRPQDGFQIHRSSIKRNF